MHEDVCVMLLCMWWLLFSWSWTVLSLSCVCSVAVVYIGMCPLICVQCDCLAVDRTNFVVFHPLTSFEVKTRRFKKKIDIQNNYAKLSDESSAGQKNQLDIEKYPIGRNTL